jgi:hypothetical protein
LGIALGGPLHEPIKGFRPIGRIGAFAARFRGNLNDPILGKPEIFDPTAYMLLGRPALPPGGQGRVGLKAERTEQRGKEPIKIGIARSRVLLLLYWFT